MAHARGIPSNATMLYGHIETYAERVEHLRLLREQQDRSGGFLAFIPLEYQISEEKLVPRHASALDDLKTIAVSRLMLDNFPHVKAYWIMLQEDTAGIALNFGADDIDGTIARERIAHAADARSPAGVTRKRAGAPDPRRRQDAGRARRAVQCRQGVRRGGCGRRGGGDLSPGAAQPRIAPRRPSAGEESSRDEGNHETETHRRRRRSCFWSSSGLVVFLYNSIDSIVKNAHRAIRLRMCAGRR